MVLFIVRGAFIAALLPLAATNAHGARGGFFGRRNGRAWREHGLSAQALQPHESDAARRQSGLGVIQKKGVCGFGCLPAMGVTVKRAAVTQLQAEKRSPPLNDQVESSDDTEGDAPAETGTEIADNSMRKIAPWGILRPGRKRGDLSMAGRVGIQMAVTVDEPDGEESSSALHTAGMTRGGAAAAQSVPSANLGGGTAAAPAASWDNAVDGLKNGLASGLAAACVKTVLQPFDTMKTVQQFSTTRMTLLQAGRDLIARGGVRELYQGLGVTLVGSMPAVGVYFGLYQFVKKQMDAKEGMSPYVSITVSAGVGNFIASLFRVPYEVVKQRLQVGMYPNTMVALESIYRQEGLLGFFGKGGLKTQWARDIPYAMVTLLVYETLQKAAARRRKPGDPPAAKVLENMIIGAVAGGVGSLVTNPMDMIKTRMMTSPELYAGPMDAAWIALRTEGPQAFMKGSTPRLLHKIPANGFFFVAYEFFRTVLGVTR